MRRLIIPAFVATALAPSSAGANNPFENKWEFANEDRPDEVALADVDGDGSKEIAVIMNGGVYVDDIAFENGSVTLLNGDGSERWSFETGADFNGYPGVADLDGDGHDEIAACETAAEGMCYLLDGDGSVVWQAGPYFWPSLWTMGPEIADLDGDGSTEVVIPSFGGLVAVLDGATGQTKWEYDAWDADGELFYGGAAIGNIDGDSAQEIVLFGWQQGKVLAIDGATGNRDMVSDALYDLHGNAAFGNTPVLADLDADGRKDIVTTAFGWTENAATFALDGDGNVLWRTETAGQLVWVGPSVEDTDTDGTPEVFVQDAAGALCRLEQNGDVTHVKQMGDNSWFEPLIMDGTGDLVADVMGGGWDSFQVTRGSDLDTIFDYERAGAGHWAPLLGDIDNDGELELLLSGWIDRKLVALDTGIAGGGAFPSGNLALDLRAIAIAAQTQGLGSEATELLDAAEYALTSPLHEVLDKVEDAFEDLEESADGNYLAQQIVLAVQRAAEQELERAMAIMGPDSPTVIEAQQALAAVQAQIQSGNWEEAMDLLEEVADDELEELDYQVSACPDTPSHDALAHLCQVQSSMALLADYEEEAPSDAQGSLEDASLRMEALSVAIATSDIKTVSEAAKEAADALTEAGEKGADGGVIESMLEELAAATFGQVQEAVVTAQVVHSDAEKAADAEATLALAQTAISQGNYGVAFELMKEAIGYIS